MNISKILLFPSLLLQNLNVAEEVLVWTEQAALAFGRYCLTWQRWSQLEATKSQPMKKKLKNFFYMTEQIKSHFQWRLKYRTLEFRTHLKSEHFFS